MLQDLKKKGNKFETEKKLTKKKLEKEKTQRKNLADEQTRKSKKIRRRIIM